MTFTYEFTNMFLFNTSPNTIIIRLCFTQNILVYSTPSNLRVRLYTCVYSEATNNIYILYIKRILCNTCIMLHKYNKYVVRTKKIIQGK